MENKEPRVWKHRTGSFPLGGKTLIMGVLNVTPDSFSDGGRFLQREDALRQAVYLQESGADLLDIGAESTRPGSLPVAVEEQLARLLPVLEALTERIRIPISVDTSSAKVAGSCIERGASIINDITGFQGDAGLPEVCAQSGAGVVLMHMRGTPETMQQEPEYDDLIAEVRGLLHRGVERAMDRGIERDCVVVDPGIGFGKTFDQNYELLRNLHAFASLAAGVLVGTSRKGFTGEFSRLPADQRHYSTAATVAISVLNGADIVRVHDVKEMKQVIEICDRYGQLQRDSDSAA